MKIEQARPVNEAATWSQRFQDLQRQKEIKASQEIWTDHTEVTINTNGIGHFAVCFLSDVHLGHVGTNYKEIDRYIKAMRENNIHTVLLGDLGDFFNPKILAHAMMGDIEDVDQQMETIRSFFLQLNGEDKTDPGILAMVSGNHEAFAKNSAGIDPYRWMARDLGVPLLTAGSNLRLNVDEQTYDVGLWHKFKRYNSTLNQTHAGKQNKRMLGRPMDMVVSGDKHIGAMEQFVDGEQITTVLQLGTFKEQDAWGREEGMLPPPAIFFPVVLFNGKQHDILPIRNLDTAVDTIRLFREGTRSKAQALLGIAGQAEGELQNPKSP